MLRETALAALMVVSTLVGSAHATRWIGPASMSGEVAKPQEYIDAVAELFREDFNFDALVPGENVKQQDLGGLSLTTNSVNTLVVAGSGSVAGAVPSSAPIALQVTQASSQPTTLIFQVTEPVISIGFVLMGLESSATMDVIGGASGSELLGQYIIPAPSQAGVRRWVGISEDNRIIWSVRIQPSGIENYAIDDVQVGVHAPEPAMLMGWGILVVGYCSVRRTRRR